MLFISNYHTPFTISKSWLNSFKKISISSNLLIVLSCAYVALVLNAPFLLKAASVITSSDDYSLLFLLSVPVFLLSLFIFINSFMAIGYLLKPVLIMTVFVSSIIFYAISNYGIVFDYTMVQNAIETDSTEALSYLNIYLISFLILFGVLPSLLIYWAPIRQLSIGQNILSRLWLIGLCLLVIVPIVGSFYVNYAAVGRNNSDLITYVTPYKLLDSSVKFVKRSYFSPHRDFQLLDTTPSLSDSTGATKVTVLVLGETARAQNFSLNGYATPTNQYTQAKEVMSFSNVASCGTATAVSVPCMFSRLDRRSYDQQTADSQQNVLDIIQLAGSDVLWIDNNNGSCKGVCARVKSIELSPEIKNQFCDGEYCVDEALLSPLGDKLDHLTHHNTLIVLHMMGSHGPTYFRRFPQNKRPFTPDCQRSDIQNCTQQELINTYDNTIAYTDYVLSKIIEKLTLLEQTKDIKTSMLYISDHGESLGEKGVYLHGLPYAFAPSEQTHVPMIYWQGSAMLDKNPACIKSMTAQSISHDNLFDTLLGITSVKSSTYNASMDVLAQCPILGVLANTEFENNQMDIL
jgi:lipid A ethanolaminephosphotransferase